MRRFMCAGAVVVSVAIGVSSAAHAGSGAYEVWASDQSNSVSGASARGVEGSFIWIWDSADIETQLAGGAAAVPRGCDGDPHSVGPCDLNDVFPGTLEELDASYNSLGSALQLDAPGLPRLRRLLLSGNCLTTLRLDSECAPRPG